MSLGDLIFWMPQTDRGCAVCGRHFPHYDKGHLNPELPMTLDNIVPMCVDCNNWAGVSNVHSMLDERTLIGLRNSGRLRSFADDRPYLCHCEWWDGFADDLAHKFCHDVHRHETSTSPACRAFEFVFFSPFIPCRMTSCIVDNIRIDLFRRGRSHSGSSSCSGWK